ncbi:MAG: HAMP domain-containing sensor histidine kinase [Jaaginema sp. PMC 1079.18]|nr:HAMP domain-containing sensor histidine kinase [Jaaginema sp. PMC 1080.18]MEC4852364.1 HAMP domain-containing sensor histidine kinase [Jaaginema sp. PMC 1079.18]MEC4866389.1 HAMP domain-containing sensor histidine kinase [Jaaginema sp. PMC 1078.18]
MAISVLWHYRQRQQLTKILEIAAQGKAENSSFSVTSRLRREITRSRAISTALEAEITVWETAIAIAPIGYLRLDRENQLVSCNAVARQLLCIDRWQPNRLRLLLELVRSYELDRAIEQARHSQTVQIEDWVFETTTIEPQGDRPSILHTVPLRATCIPLPDEQVGVFLEDRSAILELTQARDRAFSDIMHELRTPLTSISLVAEMLQSRLTGQEKTWVERLLQETNRLIDLIQNCLEISRLQKNPQQHLKYEKIEIKTFLLGLWQTLEPLAKQKSIVLNYQGLDYLSFWADSGRLSQVFLNIFDNSIKYSPSESAVILEVQPLRSPSLSQVSEPDSPDSWIIINIIDSGCGFSAEDLPHVFERLYRGDPSRTRQPSREQPESEAGNRDSSGLGLAIAQQIIQAHGGTISAQNHPTTQGAWLSIQLPNIIYS